MPLRRRWEPPEEWAALIKRHEFNDAFFYHGSEGELAAVRWRNWKLQLTPAPQLYDLAADVGETKPVRNGEISRKLRGMAILFQQEMLADARPPGVVNKPTANGKTVIPQLMSEGLNASLGVTYARYGDRTLEMDIYRPNDAWGKLPAVVCIHGGGWAKGSRESHGRWRRRWLVEDMWQPQFRIVSVARRNSLHRFTTARPRCVSFGRMLMSMVSMQITLVRLVFLRGGHLTALLATSGGVADLEGNGGNAGSSSVIQAAVPMGAQTDFLSERTREVSAADPKGVIWQQFLGGTQEERPAVYKAASPLTHLDAGDPPCWFIAGEHDDASTHADVFREQMNHHGISSGLTVLKDAPHGFIGKQVWFDQMVEKADQFLKDSFGGEK